MDMELTEYVGQATIVPMNSKVWATPSALPAKKIHCMDFPEGEVVALTYPEYPDERPKLASVTHWDGAFCHTVAVSADLAPTTAPKEVIAKITRLEASNKIHPGQMHLNFQLGNEDD